MKKYEILLLESLTELAVDVKFGWISNSRFCSFVIAVVVGMVEKVTVVPSMDVGLAIPFLCAS